MITLEQVKLLESRVGKAIELIKKLSGENLSLKTQLEAEKKRAAEIEGQNRRLKAEQGRIEEGILLTLEMLNQFEDAVEQNLKGRRPEPAAGKAGVAAENPKAVAPAVPLPPVPAAEAAPGAGSGSEETPVPPAEDPPPSGEEDDPDPAEDPAAPEETRGEELDLF
jgi:hypothetical protein